MSKIPRPFITAYLKAKGWRETFHFNCECGVEEQFCPEHPIKFLWEHIMQGHKPYFDMCHTWERQVGRYPGPWEEKEIWYGWWTATWNPKTKSFDVEVDVIEQS